jgi:hypothetical protein
MGMGQLNGGLVVLQPDGAVYEAIVRFLRSDRATPENLPFADQSLLSELFRGRWVALPWVYNGLKTMRWERVHGRLWYVFFSSSFLLFQSDHGYHPETPVNMGGHKGTWCLQPSQSNPSERNKRLTLSPHSRDDEKVKNVHYILTPKPWEMGEQDAARLVDGPDRWWWDVEWERRRWEAETELGRKAGRQVNGKTTGQSLGRGGSQVRVC